MTELHIASIPKLMVLQEACERLVMHNHIQLSCEYNIQERRRLLDMAAEAEVIGDHIRHLISIHKYENDV